MVLLRPKEPNIGINKCFLELKKPNFGMFAKSFYRPKEPNIGINTSFLGPKEPNIVVKLICVKGDCWLVHVL